MSKTTITEEEIRNRHKLGIGGSEIAAIYGLSPWATPLTVWLEKTGRKPPREFNAAMDMGAELEDLVARKFSQETGRKVCRWKGLLKDGHIIGNVDRLIYGPNGEMPYKPGTAEICAEEALECKTTGSDWTDGVPLHYQMQVQQYMALMPSVKRFYFAVLNTTTKKYLPPFIVERDEAVIESIRKTVPEWWAKYVEADTAPLPSSVEDCRQIYKTPAPKPVAASPLAEQVAEYLAKCENAAALIEAEADKARTFLLAYMGDIGDSLVTPDGRTICTWKQAKGRTTTAWKDVALELGATQADIERHSTTSEGSRRFLLKVNAAPFESRSNEFLAESDQVRKEIAESGIAV